MSPFNLQTCARPNILQLEPYRCARDDYKDDGHNILLDANENAFGPPISPSTASALNQSAAANIDLLGLHRYPDPHQHALKDLLISLRNTHHHTTKSLTPANLFVGVGSDEAIDALLRAFCTPAHDTILVCPPTYGMYSVSACVNDIGLTKIPLLPAPDFQLDVPAILSALDNVATNHVKLIYLCSPGNPTGARLAKSDVQRILEHPSWNGIVVLDEAYIDFATSDPAASLAEWVAEWPNLVVLQTLSKAFGLAGIRLGAAFASAPVARLLNALKAPYNVSSPTAALAAHALSADGLARVRANVAALEAQRSRMVRALDQIPGVGRLRGGLDGNFLLYEMLDAHGRPSNEVALAVYERLAEGRGVVVRFRGREHGCEGCLRITVGTEEEVTRFLDALKTVLVEVRGGDGAKAGDAKDEERKEVAANDVVA